MKKLMIDTLVVMGTLTFAGMMYVKKHPEKIENMKERVKDMSRTIYNKLDEED